jgi:hypothetical protein
MNNLNSPLSTSINELLTYARLAPSVHNAQPWRFKVDGTVISLNVNPERVLGSGDPTHRELWISLGICLETLLQAAKGLGITTDVQSVQTDSLDEPVAKISLSISQAKQPDVLRLIQDRYSYRGSMTHITLPNPLLEQCRQLLTDLPDTSVFLMDDPASINRIAKFTYQAMRLALSNPAFRKELARLINYNWSKSHVGMHGFALNRGLVGSIWEKWSIRLGLDIQRKASADQRKIQESSGLVFIASKGDVPHYWFDAGRAYMRVALKLTEMNLAQSTLAAPVEAASFHEDIENMLHTSDRIQSMIRIGKASNDDKHRVVRSDISELLVT